MKSEITIGVIGLGSMGKRRVRDSIRLNLNVVGFDIRKDRCIESEKLFGIQTVSSFEQLLERKPEAIIISTPPDIHYTYYEKCFKNSIPFFSEANIFTPKTSWFKKMEKKNKVKGYPSATWKFHPCFKFLKKNCSKTSLKINSVHYNYAGFLPFWHPYEDYSKFYAGQKKTSAAREMVPFEMESLVWLFGPVKQLCASYGKSRNWKTNMDDYYHILLEFESGLPGFINIELHQVSPYRNANISCYDRSFYFDGNQHVIKEFDLNDNSFKIHRPESQRTLGSFDFEDIYYEEIKHFFESVFNKITYCKDWEEDRHLSDILYAAEMSMKTRKWIRIRDIENEYSGDSWK